VYVYFLRAALTFFQRHFCTASVCQEYFISRPDSFRELEGLFLFGWVSERLVESASILRSAPPHSKILTIENKDSILAVTARNFVDLLSTNEKLQVLQI
jgi:hypothetical protein